MFNDAARLVFCLIIHPLVLEFCLHMCRSNSNEDYDNNMRAAGLDPNEMTSGGREALYNCETGTPLIVESILVFNRRFLIGKVLSLQSAAHTHKCYEFPCQEI